MASAALRSDLRWEIHIETGLNPTGPEAVSSFSALKFTAANSRSRATRAYNTVAKVADNDKTPICTADELHYVSAHNSRWKLALWRYRPSPKGPRRNHPLLLLSGVGTNAIGYDLDPGSSFVRYMSSKGFDTWILEVRGAGLSVEQSVRKVKQHVDVSFEQINSGNEFELDEAYSRKEVPTVRSNMFEEPKTIPSNQEVSGILEYQQNSDIADQIRDLSQRLVKIIVEGQRLVSPQFISLQECFSTTVEYFQIPLVKYNWDFDHYLEEDVPAAMEYIRTHCKPMDGKLLAIGHSMGGILLYAMLSQNGCRERESDLASVVTLGSSLDYTTSRSSLKLLLPLVDPAKLLNVPVVPIGTLLSAAHPLASRPPYLLSWLNPLVSAENMMQPELLEKLILNNFCTVPAKLLLQLTTVFQEGGLCDRSGNFVYKDHLQKSNVPVLAIAGDQDLICPPEAVYETAKLIPEDFITFKVFGEPQGPHYGHYDLVGSHLACYQVYPSIIKFLTKCDLP